MGSQRGAGALAQAKELASGGRIRAQERSTTEGVDGSEREPQNQGWLLDLGFDGWTVGRRGQLVRRGGWRERRGEAQGLEVLLNQRGCCLGRTGLFVL